MSDKPPKAFYDSDDDMVMLGHEQFEDSFIWFRADEIQAVVTSLLQAHADYVDEKSRRAVEP